MAANANYLEDGLLASASLKIGGTDIGYSSGGVDINFTEDRTKFYVDQLRTAVKEKRKEVECEVTIRLAQLEITTLRYALGQAAGSMSGSTALILDDTEPSATTLEFVIEMTDAPNMKFYFHKAEFVAGGGFSFKTGEMSVAPVTFKCKLSDTGSKFGYIYHGVGV